MSAGPSVSVDALPSSQQLVRATAVAFVVALIIVVGAVLPVEYGIDPTGAGRVLGLLRAKDAQDETPIPAQQGDAALEPFQQENVALYGAPYRVNTVEFVLEPYEYLEYKYHLVQGASMVFTWLADAKLTHDFHGEPDGNPEAVKSYDKGTKSGANGSFTAPMTGIHGWFWENPGNKPITIRLTSAGYYSYAMEFKSDKTRKRHDVGAVTAQPPPQ